jgi:hypothetical protein
MEVRNQWVTRWIFLISKLTASVGPSPRRDVVGEDLPAPLGPRLGQPIELGHPRRPALGQEAVEEMCGLDWAGGGVEVPQALLGQPSVEHLAPRTASQP